MKKIPTEVKKELISIAQSLPEAQTREFLEQRVIKGTQLINSGINEINNNEVVNKNKVYLSEAQPKQIDHYKQLRKLWLKSKDDKEAWQKVKAYEAQIKHKLSQN